MERGLVYALEDTSVNGPEEQITAGILFNSTQSIEGNGFASEYHFFFTGPTESKSKTHGSGYLKKDDGQLVQDGIRLVSANNNYLSDSNRLIRINKNEEMVSGPSSINFGGTLRAGPFRSLWQDYDLNHQHTAGLSIILDIDQAQVVTKNLVSEISGTGSDDLFEKEEKATFKAQLDYNTSFSGRARFEIVQRRPTDSEKGLIDQLITDQTFIGPMTITNKLLLERKARSKSNEDEWLDCCHGGWNSMTLPEKRDFGLSADGIFNCTCYQSP
jgi:hypothetical protein